MPMRITIQVTCDTPEDAQDAIARLTRPRTWVDDVAARDRKAGVSEARINEIMGAPAQPAERANVSPGEPSIGKIGKDNMDMLIKSVSGDGAFHKYEKWAEHMKLLWKRGAVKFDGKEYYL